MTTKLSCHPLLPYGYISAGAWGFRGSDGASYEFCRVYAPAAPSSNGHDGICRIDDNLSYWVVIADDTSAESTGQSLNFQAARKLLSDSLSFSRFSSPALMNEELPRLFQRAHSLSRH